MISETILTAGPYIDYREGLYALDAAVNGWNNNHSEYIKRFEKAFAAYINVDYAMVTSSCTGALHLALKALGVEKGDEVIIPEITWIATASAVRYVEAIPVFCDIDPNTWVMDINSVKSKITSKTKVIIPVHLYGQPVDMNPLMELAAKHGIKILEDAAPSVGAEYFGKRTGSFGDFAAFSFQGAKAIVTGEGGMLVGNNRELIEKARFINDHGRDPNRPLCSVEIGQKYKMSNIQAALGLAQIQKAEEIVAKKRKIFSWYSERLSDLPELQLNVEKPNTRNIFWMTSAILSKELFSKISRDEFIKRLRERNIDSRPFFFPISSFPMFEKNDFQNPVSYDVPLRGINLPSGHNRTEEEIDYICVHIKEILGKNSQPSFSLVGKDNWLTFREKVKNTLKETKNSKCNLPVKDKGLLVSFTSEDVNDDGKIDLLKKWRISSQEYFPSQFEVTKEGTKKWAKDGVIDVSDRVLFLVENLDKKPVGHVGLYRFDYKEKCCELDNIVRGENISPGIMLDACAKLVEWSFQELGIEHIYLRVFSDNAKAMKLYNSLGFTEIQRVPMRKIQDPEKNITEWIPVLSDPYRETERYFVTMKLSKKGK